MPTIYPLLKPHDWPHKPHVAHRALEVPGAGEGAPIVAYGFDNGQNYVFVPWSKCDDAAALDREALANLAALDYPWELGDSHGLRFAASSGKEFSAERVLDPIAMLEAHRLLESDRIVACAPRRTCLMATRDGQPDDAMQLFERLVWHTFRDASYGHAPISTALLVLEDGVIREVRPARDVAVAKPWWKFWA